MKQLAVGENHIQFRAVRYRYPQGGGEVRCDGFSIAPGEFVGVLGASGAGKSTVLKLCAGILAPHAGEVLLNGRPVLLIPPRERRIGYVPQRLALFAHMSVARNVGFRLWTGRTPGTVVQQATADLLHELGIQDLAARRASDLSGGQAQRVAIARALAGDTSLLLLDEPFASLDRVNLDSAVALLRDVQRSRHITTLLVTHDRDQAMTLADRVALIAGGEVRQIAPPREVYERPAASDLALLAGAGSLLPGHVRDVSERRVLVETPLGLLSSIWMGSDEVSRGTPCRILIRPEWMQVQPTRVSNWQIRQAHWRGRDAEIVASDGNCSVTIVGGGELLDLSGNVVVTVKRECVLPSYPVPSGGRDA